MQPITRYLSILLVSAVISSPLQARIDQPSHVFYGNATLFGNEVEPGTVVEARLVETGQTIVRYKMGRDPRLNGQYALPVAMDDIEPQQAGHARPGNELRIYIGTQLAAETIVGAIGRATRVDIDPQFVEGGPNISIADTQLLEGTANDTTPISLPVDMSTTADQDIVIGWSTRDDSAIGGFDCSTSADFVADSGSLTIPAGQMSGTITVEACADDQPEPDELFFVDLDSTSYGSFSKQSAGINLLDDDDNPDIMVADAWIEEPQASPALATFSVSLSRDHDHPVSFDWATENLSATTPQDYVADSGTVQIEAGSINAEIQITVNPDSEIEAQEAFALRLSNAQLGNLQRTTAAAIIVDPRFDPAIEHEQDAINDEDGIYGIADPSAVTVSNDGRHVYVTSESTGQLTLFQRMARNGRLSVLASIDDTVAGFTNMLLDGPVDIVASDDDAYLYVAAKASDAIVVLARSSADGSLSFIQNQAHGSVGVSGIQDVARLALSPDGEHLYASGSNSVAVFSRDAQTGELTFVESEQNNIDDPEDSGGTVVSLNRAMGLALSPDGNQLLVASRLGDSLLVFDRDSDPESAQFGQLSFVENLKDNENGIEGLDGTTDVAISSSGQQVYVTAEASNTLVHYNRQPNGELDGARIWQSGEAALPGMAGAQHLLLAPDNEELFVTGFTDSSLTVLRRQVDDMGPNSIGDLTVRETLFDDQGQTQFLGGATDMAISPNNVHLYVVANQDNAIVVFQRLSADDMFSDAFETR